MGIEAECDRIRFWGKLLGIKHDYFIVECSTTNDEIQEPDGLCEVTGTGINSNVYYVTNDPLQDWTRLPNVHPTHLEQVKLFKHILTGNYIHSLIHLLSPIL